MVAELKKTQGTLVEQWPLNLESLTVNVVYDGSWDFQVKFI